MTQLIEERDLVSFYSQLLHQIFPGTTAILPSANEISVHFVLPRMKSLFNILC